MNCQSTASRPSSPANPAAPRLWLVDDAMRDGGDSVWQHVRGGASLLAADEPLLAPMLDELVLAPATPAALVASVLARRLGGRGLGEGVLRGLFQEVLAAQPALASCVAADLHAIMLRDPACPSHLHALLNLKGFHALQVYRIAHALWQDGRQALAFELHGHAASSFAVDIHPAARIGTGVMLDHGTGIVVGETAVIEDNVSLLQNVTLGGTGKEHGDRHPKVRTGVMIGAGAKILGNIEIGAMSKVAAGSVVLRDVPPHCTVAGVPSRIVRHHLQQNPAFEMDQML